MEAVTYDPYSFEIDDDPFPVYRRLRDEAPCYRNEELGFVALSRYVDIRRALNSPAAFSSAHGITIEDLGGAVPKSILETDPPEHTRLRRLISGAFTPRRVTDLEPRVREIARAQVADLAANGGGDVIAPFAGLLPIAVICELLGVPPSDAGPLRRWTEELIMRPDGGGAPPPAAMNAGFAIQQYFEDLVARRRSAPRTSAVDLVGVLLDTSDGDALTHDQLVAFLWLLLIAGNDTSARSIGNAIELLGRFPAQRRRVVDDGSLVAAACDEVLRFDGAAHMIVRTAISPQELHGTTIEPGTKVAMLLASGNRDERIWRDADIFDLARDGGATLAFGHGPHHCLGAPLGRMQIRVALEEFLAVFPDYEVDLASARRARSAAFRGFARLPIIPTDW